MGRVAAIGPVGLLHADLLRQKNSALRMPQTNRHAAASRHPAFRGMLHSAVMFVAGESGPPPRYRVAAEGAIRPESLR